MPVDPPPPASSPPAVVLPRVDGAPDEVRAGEVRPGEVRPGEVRPVEVQPSTPRWDDGPERGSVLHPACAACDRVAFHPGDPTDRDELVSPEVAAGLLVPRFAGADRERCLAALLDTKHRLLEVVLVSVGSLDHTFMSPREIFRDALLANAAAVVLAHNHPSGDPEPSRDDELVTRRLVRAGELVGVEVLDHLVVAGQRWISLARRGLV